MAGNRGIDPHPTDANGSGPPGKVRPADLFGVGAEDQVDLQDKVALIVDGATADSRTLALALARRGMHVTFLYFHEEHRLAAAVKEQIEAQERRCLLISWADLAGDAPDVVEGDRFAEWTMEHIRETFGRLDVFVNLSTHQRPLNGDDAPPAQRQNLRSRLFPHLNITKEALSQIAETDPDS